MINDMMEREIAAQASVLADCLGPIASAVSKLAGAEGRIFAGGCGDSVFAPAALAGVFAAMDIDIVARTSMSLAGFTRFLAGDTVILSSISGGTKRTVDAATIAHAAGARVIAVTCNQDSALANVADDTILLPFTPLSRKTPHTLDYAVTMLALVRLGLHFKGKAAEDLTHILGKVPSLLEDARTRAVAIAAGMGEGKLFLLGAGPDLGSAEYGAAKFHEAGGLVAIAAETENFIHGMNFMVEPEDTILALAGNVAGRSRGEGVVEQFSTFVAHAGLIGGPPENPSWAAEFRSVLRTTFELQCLCLAVANTKNLALESPRAGRDNGSVHLEIQSRLMAR
jgi:fructoselysine-6-P-deglycase FrlB-like protein